MSESYINLNEFAAAREQFEYLANNLESGEMTGWQHSDVEAWISTEGTELMRRLLQGYLDLQGKNEKVLEIAPGADGVIRNHRRQGCGRSLMSLFGQVRVNRKGYGQRGETSLFPLDGVLNLPGDKYSHGLRRRVAEEVSRGSFDAGVERVTRTTGGKVPKRQAEELAWRAADDFELFYETRVTEAADLTSDPLIISVDGKGIVMRPEGLREVTRKASERDKHKLKTRLSKGEKRNRKRMATVAAVYSIEQQVRTAEEIMNLTDRPAKQIRPRARDKRVWASVEREPETVIEEAVREALFRDPGQRRAWAILIDGQEQQLWNIESCLAKHRLSATIILDFIHVLEYLWKAAYCFEEEGSEAAETWVAARAKRILEGRASDVAAGIRRSATLKGLNAQERKPADTCADYLLKYSDLLKYDQYLADGLPIATGVIDGACRHLIKDRMDITGARWGLSSAEAILKLRSLQSSGDFEDYWDFHLEQEFADNHLSCYKKFPLVYAA